MGIYQRPDSKYWWLWLETAPPGHQKEKTAILLGQTVTQRRDAERLARDTYHARMQAIAQSKITSLPIERPAIRFALYAEQYARNVIALRRGARREQELLIPLRRVFDESLLTTIDADLVRSYMATRISEGVKPRTVNREVDLLKGLLRDAVPKYLPMSPIVGLRRLTAPPVTRRLLHSAEERRLLEVCEDAQDRAILILGIDTLIRLGDLLDLQRQDRQGPWLRVNDPKSGHAYEVALSPRAQDALDAMMGTDPYYFVKFRRARKSRDWAGSVRQRLEYLCRKANLPYGWMKNGITFHWATRRTGATRFLIEKQSPLPAVQRQGNWKHPELLLQIYAEARRDDQLRMVGAVVPRRPAHGRIQGIKTRRSSGNST